MAGQPRSTSLLSPAAIGDVNRSRVLQALCDHGPMSRAELAKMAGVTRATIGNIVQALIDQGLVEEGAPGATTGRVGKPGRPVWFGPKAGLSGAVAVTASTVEAAVVNARGDVLDLTSVPLNGADADSRAVAAAASAALDAVLPKRDGILGIGVAVPGVCDTATGAVIGSGQLPRLSGTGLVGALERRFERRVLVDNDSRTQALGEKWFGDGRGVPTFAAVQTGHGLGVGIVLAGVVFRGRRGRTGELGHTCVDPDGAFCRCGLRGCWETIATLRWLRGEARKARLPKPGSLDAASLMALAAESKPAAALLERYTDNLAIGLANLMQLIDPDALILHGDVVGAGEPMRQSIEAAVRARSLAYLRPSVRIVFSKLDRRAALVGAAGLVLSETFDLRT